MNNLILSICIPTYNRANYLKECLNSIVCQFKDNEIYEQAEIVISDNASDDNTSEVIDEFQKKYTNIAYFRNDSNLGCSKNLYNALNNAKGKYLWILGMMT